MKAILKPIDRGLAPMKLKHLTFYSLIALGLISCDPSGRYEYWIQNQSNSTLFVSHRMTHNDTIKYHQLNQGQEFKILQSETRGGLYDKGLDYLFSYCDSLAIYSDIPY